MLNPTISKRTTQGSVDGSLFLNGSFTHAKPAGKLKVDGLTWKQCDIYDLSGTVSMSAAQTGQKQVGKLEISSLQYKKLPVKNITGRSRIQLCRRQPGIVGSD